MKALSDVSAEGGRDSSVVWKSAMRFWVRRRIRLRPWTANWRGEGGRTELSKEEQCGSDKMFLTKEFKLYTCSHSKTFAIGRSIGRTQGHPSS